MEKEFKYKSTGLEWMPEIPEHWEIRRIKNLFYETDLKSQSGEEELLSVSNYTGVTLKKEKLENEEGFITNAESTVGYKLVSKGDLIINIMLAWNGSLGVSKFDGITSPAYCVYRAKKNLSVNYYGYLFTTNLYKTQFKRNSKGIIESRLRLYSDNFFNIFAINPPLSEQEEIVGYIQTKEEKINRFIEKKQRFVELLKEQRQGIINEYFEIIPNSWETKRLKNIAKIIVSSVDKIINPDEKIVSLCNYLDVYRNDYITSNLEFMKASANLSEIEKNKIFKDDIIITKDSEDPSDIAIPSYVPENFDNLICGYHLAIIRSDKNEIFSEFIFRYFQSKKIRAYFEINSKGFTRFGIGVHVISNVDVSYPTSISEQEEIVQKIKEETKIIDTAIGKAEREIELIKEYRESMISEAIIGKYKR